MRIAAIIAAALLPSAALAAEPTACPAPAWDATRMPEPTVRSDAPRFVVVRPHSAQLPDRRVCYGAGRLGPLKSGWLYEIYAVDPDLKGGPVRYVALTGFGNDTRGLVFVGAVMVR